MNARQRRIAARKVRVGVGYGMGGSASAEFRREEIAGKSAREVITQVLGRPQPSESATRTAKVLAEAMKTTRAIDAELIRASRDKADGKPISLDEVVVDHEEAEGQDESVVMQEIEEVTLRVSESYRGGDRQCRYSRSA
jgi:hypothetical protein